MSQSVLVTILAAMSLVAVPTFDRRCAAWNQLVERLTPAERSTLLREGGVDTSTTFVIDRSVIPSCDARIVVGQYIRQVIGGHVQEPNQALAQRYSRDLKAAILRVWPSLSGSKAFPRDGAFREEAYGILQGLTDADFADVLHRLIASEGLNLELTYVVLNRPLPSLLPDLLAYGRRTASTDQAIYAFAR